MGFNYSVLWLFLVLWFRSSSWNTRSSCFYLLGHLISVIWPCILLNTWWKFFVICWGKFLEFEPKERPFWTNMFYRNRTWGWQRCSNLPTREFLKCISKNSFYFIYWWPSAVMLVKVHLYVRLNIRP